MDGWTSQREGFVYAPNWSYKTAEALYWA